jgi:hypothetical protein
MRVGMPASLLLLPLALPPEVADTPTVPIDVVAIVSGGYWVHDNFSGFVRVIVSNGGFEHVSSTVVAEWISEPRSTAERPRVARALELVAPGFVSLGAPVLERRGNLMRVTIEGVLSHEPAATVRCVFDLRPDGTAETIRSCDPHGT